MQVKMVEVGRLRPHPLNPREHPERALEKLARSFAEYGWTNPILVSADDYVLAGHARLKAAQLAGMKEVPVIYLPLAGARAEAYMIADNKLQEETGWDMPVLKDLLERLDTGELDIEITGFEMGEIEDIMTQHYVPGDDVEAIPELPDLPVSKRGDLWALGEHRVLCGDSTDSEDFERLMAGRQAEMIFTDPPYNVNYGAKAEKLRIYNKGQRNTDNLENDNLEAEAFREFLLAAFRHSYAHTSAGGALYVCHAESTGSEFRVALADAGFLLKQCIVWVKNSLVLGRQDYQWKHEPILYGWKPGAAHRWYGGRKKTTVLDNSDLIAVSEDGEALRLHISDGYRHISLRVPSYEVLFDGDETETSVWNVDRPVVSLEHPTMKPVELIERAVLNSSRSGDLVLDPFGGSGSTLIGCEKKGRVCYTMELDPKYVDVIVGRWENLTGGRADLVGEGVFAGGNSPRAAG